MCVHVRMHICVCSLSVCAYACVCIAMAKNLYITLWIYERSDNQQF